MLAMNRKANGTPPKLAKTPDAVTTSAAQDGPPRGVDGIGQERPAIPARSR